MARQLRTPSTSTSSRASFAPTFVEQRLNGESIKLLKAPTIEDATMDELNDMMRQAVQNENYELAARVRDEIEKRAR